MICYGKVDRKPEVVGRKKCIAIIYNTVTTQPSHGNSDDNLVYIIHDKYAVLYEIDDRQTYIKV